METDDAKRGNSGVVCSLRDLGNGRVRLVLDDVSNPEFSTKGKWSHEVVFTWKDYDFSKIENQELSEKELADLVLISLCGWVCCSSSRTNSYVKGAV